MESADALVTWLELMTRDELAELAASYDWLAVHLDWSQRPQTGAFLQAVDALIVNEKSRRIDPDPEARDTVLDYAFAVGMAMAGLDRAELQTLLHSYRRLARNRERDASEPVQRFHAAIGDLLTRELTLRLDDGHSHQR